MQIVGTDLKPRFYEHMRLLARDQQIFIVDNTEPPTEVQEIAIHFTKNPEIPRYGLFPHIQDTPARERVIRTTPPPTK
jgi:hypothetical protein